MKRKVIDVYAGLKQERWLWFVEFYEVEDTFFVVGRTIYDAVRAARLAAKKHTAVRRVGQHGRGLTPTRAERKGTMDAEVRQ